jgi:hypothetical protein
MSLESRVTDLSVRIGTEFKTVKTKMAGVSTGDLSSLTTTAKTSLLAAINEVKEGVNTINNTKGQAGGFAGLGADGKVPSGQLPAYVDDVLEYANFSMLPAVGSAGLIYVTINDNKTFRWSGTAYTEISASLVLGETFDTAYRGDRGKTAYNHSQLKGGNPHETSFGSLLNTPNDLAGYGILNAYTKAEIGYNERDFVYQFEQALL